MGKGSCGKEVTRILLWVSWMMNMLITTVYYILCFATFDALYKNYSDLFKVDIPVNGTGGTGINDINLKTIRQRFNITQEVWRAPLAATILGGLLVMVFNLTSCLVLLRKTIVRKGAGFGYGFVCAFCFTLAFFVLLCGLIMDGFSDFVKQELQDNTKWTPTNSNVFTGTVVFSYIVFAMLLVFFFALLVFQGAVSDHLGIERSTPYAKMRENPAMAGMPPGYPPGMQGYPANYPAGMQGGV